MLLESMRASKSRRGLSALEVLVTVVIIAIVAIPTIALMQQSGRGVEKTGDAMLVGAAASFLMADLRDLPFEQIISKPKWVNILSNDDNSLQNMLMALQKSVQPNQKKSLSRLEDRLSDLRYKVEVQNDSPAKDLKKVTIYLEMKGRPSRLRRQFTTVLAKVGK